MRYVGKPHNQDGSKFDIVESLILKHIMNIQYLPMYMGTSSENKNGSLQNISLSHHAKMDLNKKWLPKQKIIQNFNIDAQGFRKTRNENPPKQDIGVTS